MKKEKSLSEIRTQYGTIASIFALIANILLASAKITVGFLFGSVAILADGVNNATDSASSIVSLLSFKIANKPADSEHPFGHSRIEYIATLSIAFITMLVAVEVIISSIEKLIAGGLMEISIVMYIVLGISIAVKLAMGFSMLFASKKINSSALKATSVDAFSDCIATTAVLISSLVFQFTGINIDGYTGIVVSLFVMWSGIGILKGVINPLMGEVAPKEMSDELVRKIQKHEEVYGLHDLLIHNYGPGKYFASVHVEVAGEMDTNSSHQLADEIEEEIKTESFHLTVHIDPVGLYKNDDRIEFRRETPRFDENGVEKEKECGDDIYS